MHVSTHSPILFMIWQILPTFPKKACFMVFLVRCSLQTIASSYVLNRSFSKFYKASSKPYGDSYRTSVLVVLLSRNVKLQPLCDSEEVMNNCLHYISTLKKNITMMWIKKSRKGGSLITQRNQNTWFNTEMLQIRLGLVTCKD